MYATAIPPVCLKFDKIQDGGHLGYTKWPWLHYQFADWRHVRFYGGILDWAWDFCLRGLHTGTAVARDPCVSWAFLLKMRWAELVLMTWRLKSHLVIWCFVLSDCFLLQSNLEVPLQAWLIDWLIDGWMDGSIDRSIDRSIIDRSIDRSIDFHFYEQLTKWRARAACVTSVCVKSLWNCMSEWNLLLHTLYCKDTRQVTGCLWLWEISCNFVNTLKNFLIKQYIHYCTCGYSCNYLCSIYFGKQISMIF